LWPAVELADFAIEDSYLIASREAGGKNWDELLECDYSCGAGLIYKGN
jgi:hypothetical protein